MIMSLKMDNSNERMRCTSPDELLHVIFVSVHAVSHVKGCAVALSQVNRRFLRITFDTPTLWTKICNLQPRIDVEDFLACAERNPDACLSLCLCERTSEDAQQIQSDTEGSYLSLPVFMEIISPLRAHWEEICFQHRGW